MTSHVTSAGDGRLAWDGDDHAFLLDTKVASEHQRQGIATALVSHAVRHSKVAGCEWLHVDFAQHLSAFYIDACGFRPTSAGLIHLPTSHSLSDRPSASGSQAIRMGTEAVHRTNGPPTVGRWSAP